MKFIIRLQLITVILLAVFVGAQAQSGLLNIPTTDTQPERSFLLEFEFATHLAGLSRGGYQNYGSGFLYGLNKRSELGLSLFYNRSNPAEPAALLPNFKWKLYENEEKRIGVATGTVVTIPLTHRPEVSTRGLVYAVASKGWSQFYSPRVTAGYTLSLGTTEAGVSRSGFVAGFEQPLSRKVSMVVDWSSGKNGSVAFGPTVILSRKTLLSVGYNIGNERRGNNSLRLSYGINF